MYDNQISLNNIIINRSISLLENKYNVTFNKTVYELQAENQLVADTLNRLLSELGVCLEKLSYYTLLKYYHKNLILSLADVNYLGIGKKDLITSLQYLMDDTNAKRYKGQILPTIQLALNNIPVCPIKRLFTVILVLDRLGIDEGIACICNLLYMGGLQT